MQRSKADLGALRWDDIQLFLGLLQHPSMSRASASLGLDTSTLSRRLAALEKRLGVTLFDRTATGLQVTPAAEELAIAARAMDTSALAFVRASENFERRIEGLVRVSAPPGVTEGLVVPMLPRLAARYSRIVLELDASASFRDLTRREVDLAIRTSRPSSGDLVCQKVYTGPLWPLGSRDVVRSLGTLRSLAHARWIGSPERPPTGTARAAAMLDLPPPVLLASSLVVQIRAALEGLGLILAPRHFGYTFGLEPVRVAAPLAVTLGRLPPVELWLAAHQGHRRVPRLAAVWAFFEEEMRAIEHEARQRDAGIDVAPVSRLTEVS